MATRTVAHLFVDTLVAMGAARIFGVAGDSLNGITDAIRPRDDIEWIPVRHEETAAFAAGAEAHLTGRLGVCAGSCGPGNLHLINGLYDCHRSRVPVLALAAQISIRELGSEYFQETHPELLFRECSHYCGLVSEAEQMPRILEIAVQTALSRRGVAVVVLPGDVALRPAAHESPRSRRRAPEPSIRPSDAELAELASILNRAAKITILGGAGCAGAHAELVRTAQVLGAPVVHALRGKEFIEHDNPHDVGMTGLLGFSSGYHAMMNCDTLLMLGTDFPYQQFYPQKATVLQVDIRGEQLGRRTKVDLGVVGDVRATLSALLPALAPKTDRDHLDRCLEHYRQARRGLDDLAVGEPGKKPIHPQYVAKLVSEVAAEDAVFTCDVGTPTIWAARYLKMNGRRRLLGSFTHGSMASALPQAIGAQIADRGRQVITLSGDGGLAMLLGDLLTLQQLSLPVKLVIFNNGALGFVELEMKAAGFLDFATELHNPDFAKMAEAAGVLGLRVETPEQVRPALVRALAHDGPALLDVVVARQELAMPPSLAADQVLGFSLFMAKAVLNGRADQILDLAKTNLLR
ncbi:ubiquinone-dependent pyruvate dehydrogenase [Nannocystis punicea]|uniref:Pyruvate dehydrogenase [ubiquinone] n=1 Tax=Nannocystis punicea TaxID=2995304 RepID=A0ABY7GSQ8_9BACT|nr:ubiquinone-dependent pyruvate dehydrogenase [Nannocystis poenicansa]WAS89996.1 ubiquinone-dependent pyruvate dehydrogenase [Nannocystis poenicansa]